MINVSGVENHMNNEQVAVGFSTAAKSDPSRCFSCGSLNTEIQETTVRCIAVSCLECDAGWDLIVAVKRVDVTRFAAAVRHQEK